MEIEFTFSKPHYYKFYTLDFDVHEAQRRIWGVEAWRKHIDMEIFQYRMRAGKKEGNSVEQEFEKIQYLEELLCQFSNEQKSLTK